MIICPDLRQMHKLKLLKEIQQIFRHPQFTGDPGDFNDLALIQVKDKFQWSASVKPGCLPATHYDNELPGSLTVSGQSWNKNGLELALKPIKSSSQKAPKAINFPFLDSLVIQTILQVVGWGLTGIPYYDANKKQTGTIQKNSRILKLAYQEDITYTSFADEKCNGLDRRSVICGYNRRQVELMKILCYILCNLFMAFNRLAS